MGQWRADLKYAWTTLPRSPQVLFVVSAVCLTTLIVGVTIIVVTI